MAEEKGDKQQKEEISSTNNELAEKLADEQSSELMKGKYLAILLLVYIVYIVLGGVIFHFIEYSNEQTTATNSRGQVRDFLANNTCLTADELSKLITTVLQAYDQGIVLTGNDTDNGDTSWDIASSIFFSTTIVTTIGYGNISPATVGGQTFTVFYAIIGIPLFVYVSGQLGMRLSKLSERGTAIVGKCIKSAKWRSIMSAILIYLLGFIVFSLCAAGVFTAIEGWAYRESVYYTFITLTTIGFGDFYPSFAGGSSGSVEGVLYRIFVSIWILIGLVWMATVVSATADSIGSVIKRKRISSSKSSDTDSIQQSTQM